MVRAHKPKVRGLAFLQVFLQPPDLLAPECLARGIALRHVVDIAVQYDEVATPPVERIVGGRREIEEFIEIAVVALEVAKRGEECGFARSARRCAGTVKPGSAGRAESHCGCPAHRLDYRYRHCRCCSARKTWICPRSGSPGAAFRNPRAWCSFPPP